MRKTSTPGREIPALDAYQADAALPAPQVREDDSRFAWLEFQSLSKNGNPHYAETVPHQILRAEEVSRPRRVSPVALPAREAADKPNKFNACQTGIAAMDFEHRHLLNQLERVYQADTIENALSGVDQFIKGWNLHHLHEEQLMEKIRYPGTAKHKEGHVKLYEVYQRLRNEVMQGEFNLHSVKAYVDMVARLITDHIKQHDALYGNWAKTQGAGLSQPGRAPVHLP